MSDAGRWYGNPRRGTGKVGNAALRARLDELAAEPPVVEARRPLIWPDPPHPTISEAAFQRLVCDVAGWLGWEHHHHLVSKGSGPGWPDLVLARRTGPNPGEARVIFRELKTERGAASVEQLRWGAYLLAAGLDWAIWRPSNWGEILDTLGGR